MRGRSFSVSVFDSCFTWQGSAAKLCFGATGVSDVYKQSVTGEVSLFDLRRVPKTPADNKRTAPPETIGGGPGCSFPLIGGMVLTSEL